MPWNLVSCASSSAMPPVSTRCNPSAMVPRSKWLAALIASFGDSGRAVSSVDIAKIPALAAERIECRGAIFAVLGEDLLQHRVHVFRHAVGVAADVDDGAIGEPRQQFVAGI